MTQIIPVNYRTDILPEYQGTPAGLLLEYHNLDRALGSGPGRQLLIGMCMDSRKALRILVIEDNPDGRENEFRISFAIAIGGVRTIVLIAHTDCGMARVAHLHDEFVRGLVEHGGWDRARAEKHFADSVPKFSINDEIDFVMQEAERLRGLYPKITVVPLLYRVEDDLLYQLKA